MALFRDQFRKLDTYAEQKKVKCGIGFKDLK